MHYSDPEIYPRKTTTSPTAMDPAPTEVVRRVKLWPAAFQWKFSDRIDFPLSSPMGPPLELSSSVKGEGGGAREEKCFFAEVA